MSVNSPTIDENGTAIISGQITDPDVLDSHQVIIDWGFGAPTVKPTRVDWLLPPIGVPRNLWPARNGILIAALPFVLIS